MKRHYLYLLITFLFISSVQGQEYQAPKFGNGILNLKAQDTSWSMKVGLHLQFQGLAEWQKSDTSDSDAALNFNIRRARLKFDGFVYSPKLTYKVVLGLSNRDISGASIYTSNAPRIILDAVVKWNFYKDFELWLGQTKLPGNRESLISSANLQFVDRSILNSAYGIDRDLGLQLRHQFTLGNHFMVKEAFAFSQGEGRNITTGNVGGFQYTTRLELLPFGEFLKTGDYIGGAIYKEAVPKFALGFTYDVNDKAVKTRSNQGSYLINDAGFHTSTISTLFVDAMFKYGGFSFMAEFANRSASNPVAQNTDGSLTGAVINVGKGFNVQSGYVFENNWELSVRYTSLKIDKAVSKIPSEEQYGFAVSKYLSGHKLKIQSDLNYSLSDFAPESLMWRVQFQVHF